MTTTCTHDCAAVNHTSSMAWRWPTFNFWHALARLGAWASQGVSARYAQWSQADAIRKMNVHQLRDIGAPDWLQREAAARDAQDAYEYTKATSRIRY